MLTAANTRSALRQVMRGCPAAVRRFTVSPVGGPEYTVTGLVTQYGVDRMATNAGMTNDADVSMRIEAPDKTAPDTMEGQTGLLSDMAGTQETARRMNVVGVFPSPEGGLWRLDLVNAERVSK